MPQNETLRYQDGFPTQLCRLPLCLEILNAWIGFPGSYIF